MAIHAHPAPTLTHPIRRWTDVRPIPKNRTRSRRAWQQTVGPVLGLIGAAGFVAMIWLTGIDLLSAILRVVALPATVAVVCSVVYLVARTLRELLSETSDE